MDGKTKIDIYKGDGQMEIKVNGHNDNPVTCGAISAIMRTTELGLIALSNSVDNVIINVTKKIEKENDNE